VVMWVELCDEADHSSQPGNALYKIGVRFIGNNETAWEERQR
jgi:hypothetical protein